VSEKSLTVGAAVSITDLITALHTNADKSPNFTPLAEHLGKVANVPVRNRGTWAGNVMMAYYHEDFASDVFLLLAASNATLTTGMPRHQHCPL
jgi:xanthine dehydrogenase/oxidase